MQFQLKYSNSMYAELELVSLFILWQIMFVVFVSVSLR